jgi:hypothetical protein
MYPRFAMLVKFLRTENFDKINVPASKINKAQQEQERERQ